MAVLPSPEHQLRNLGAQCEGAVVIRMNRASVFHILPHTCQFQNGVAVDFKLLFLMKIINTICIHSHPSGTARCAVEFISSNCSDAAYNYQSLICNLHSNCHSGKLRKFLSYDCIWPCGKCTIFPLPSSVPLHFILFMNKYSCITHI
jgi:hypothetical protein